VGEVAAGSDSELEHVAGGLRARPFTAALEQQALKDADLSVVLGRFLVVKLPDSFGLAGVDQCSPRFK
jgi:hypothetical protein